MARPAASTPTVTGDICSRPSRRRVTRTAQWWVARNCRASARSIAYDLLGVGDPHPCPLPEGWQMDTNFILEALGVCGDLDACQQSHEPPDDPGVGHA